MAENYDLIFGQSASSQYAWSNSDYQNGWKTVGSTPPTAEQFDALQRRSDTKAKDLNNRLSPLETTASKALARVTPAANMLPYFNSSNSATTTAISDFIKTLLDDKDAKTARATLGAPSTTGAGASGTWGIDISGNAKTATTANTATNATHASSADSATKADKLASESGSNYVFIDNTTEDSWSVIGSNPGKWLKSIRTDVNAPPYSLGNYSAAVAFGMNDTKGIITHAYDKPRVKFAGGGGSTANWKFAIYGGSNNEVYNLNNFPTKTGDGASGTWGIDISGNAATATKATSATTAAACSGNAATATKLATPRTISLTGNASGSATFDGSGDVIISTDVNYAGQAKKLADESGSNYLSIDSKEDSWSVIGSNPGSWLKSISTNSAPPYSIGNYSAAVAFGVYDTKGIITHAYDQPRVKFAGGNGSTAKWKFTIQGGSNNEVYNLNNFPTKTGDGASGTWGIDITGNADTVDGYHASDIINKISAANTGGIVAASLTTNGYVKFANGFIIQWGSHSNTSRSWYHYTFPIAFSTVFDVIDGYSAEDTDNFYGYSNNITNTGFDMYIDNSETGRYIAIGI